MGKEMPDSLSDREKVEKLAALLGELSSRDFPEGPQRELADAFLDAMYEVLDAPSAEPPKDSRQKKIEDVEYHWRERMMKCPRCLEPLELPEFFKYLKELSAEPVGEVVTIQRIGDGCYPFLNTLETVGCGYWPVEEFKKNHKIELKKDQSIKARLTITPLQEPTDEAAI